LRDLQIRSWCAGRIRSGRAGTRATYLADYPNARLKVIDNCGHDPMQEVAVLFATEVQAFFTAP